MSSKRLVIAAAAIFIVSLFLIPPALACNYPGPEGSSILVTVKTSDGTPIPGAQVTLYVYNGSKLKTTVGPECTGGNGQFTFPGPGDVVTSLTYKVHAAFYGDEVHVDCTEGTEHSADSATFTLSAGQQHAVDITIPGVTVTHGGDGSTATPNPAKKPGEVVDKPPIPKGNHSSYPPMAPGGSPGIVAGVILADDGETPICGAYVAIVSAADPSVEYSCMYTDSNGFYIFYNVNSTADAAYKIYAAKGCNNAAYSEPFGVGSGETEKVNLVFVSKGSEAGMLLPAEEPVVPVQPSDESPSATPVPPEPATELATTTVHGGGGFLERITGFIGAVISSILPDI